MNNECKGSALESLLVLYDLRDRQAWDRAHQDRPRRVGRQYSAIHTIDADHVVVEYMPGGALDAVAS